MSVTIQFNNFDDLFDKITRSASRALAEQITNQAKALCHVGVKNGGRLRNSIMYKAHDGEGSFNDGSGEMADTRINVTPKEFESFVGTAVYYARYEEFGTRYRAPHPFLRPAILIYTGQKGAKEVMEMIKKEMAQGRVRQGVPRVFS